MNGFKETEIGWIPNEWEIFNLGSLTDIKGGKRLPMGQKLLDTRTPFPYIRVADFHNFSVRLEAVKYLPKEVQCKISGYVIEKSDVFISIAGSIGIVGIIPESLHKANLTENAARLIIKNSKQLDKKFLIFILFSDCGQNQINSYKSKNAQPKLALASIKRIQIPLPSFSEQQKIAHILTLIQNAIAKQDEIIRTATELKKALMKKLFTEGLHGEKQKETEIGLIPESWEVKPIYNLVLKTKTRNPQKVHPDKKIKYIDVSTICNDKYLIELTTEYLGKDAPGRARKVVYKNDVIFATIRPTLKRVALITDDYNDEYCSTAFCVLRTDESKLYHAYLFNYLLTDSFIAKIEELQTGANYPAVRDNDVKNQKIPLPDYAEQQEIAHLLTTIDNKIQFHEKKKQTLTDLFKTMLNQLMTGRIRVNHLDFDIKD